eukprot:TRINITY_DN666_c0_g1_i2.p1 TRINITY_DN666_c0_g1~~TRINITY_DN666_c0_g1_i2.p1  ORF type:complete len:248 (-),score=63.94 TRINITY_DN666_c0_g1_i2:458-1201(-)
MKHLKQWWGYATQAIGPIITSQTTQQSIRSNSVLNPTAHVARSRLKDMLTHDHSVVVQASQSSFSPYTAAKVEQVEINALHQSKVFTPHQLHLETPSLPEKFTTQTSTTPKQETIEKPSIDTTSTQEIIEKPSIGTTSKQEIIEKPQVKIEKIEETEKKPPTTLSQEQTEKPKLSRADRKIRLAETPVQKLKGIGPAALDVLNQAGIFKMGQLAELGPEQCSSIKVRNIRGLKDKAKLFIANPSSNK